MKRWLILAAFAMGPFLQVARRFRSQFGRLEKGVGALLVLTGVAFLTGVSLALFYVTLGIPISWLADRVSRRNILAICLVAWSAMSALCGVSRTYMQLLLARIGVGVGEAGGTPPAAPTFATASSLLG